MNTLPDKDDRNPFAPPETGFHTLGGPIDAGWTRSFTVDDVVRESWTLFKERTGLVMGLYWGMAGLSWVMQIGLRLLPELLASAAVDRFSVQIAQVGVALISVILSTWLSIGLTRALLKVARRQPTEFAEITRGGPYVLTVILAWVVMAGVMVAPAMVVAMVVGGSIRYLGKAGPPSVAVVAAVFVGFALLVAAASVVMIYILLRTSLFMYVCFDHNAGVFDSLRGSWKITEGRVATLILIAMAQTAIILLGFLAVCVGLLVAVPLTVLMHAVTYNRLSGWRPEPAPGGPKPVADADWA